jgi:predicted membrane protein
MELFLPSILIFLLAMIVVMVLIPQFSPIIIVTLAIVLLIGGMYNHFSMFMNEYRQSTWQKTLLLFAPGIFIIAIFIYLFFAIGTFFTGGKVPVPTLPEMSNPSANSATNTLTSSINNTMNATKSMLGFGENNSTKKANNEEPRNNTVGRLKRPNNAKNNNTNNNRNNSEPNSITRSQLAAV